MGKQEQHDLREYSIVTPELTLPFAGANTMIHIPIPASGQVIRCLACVTTIVTVADALITFELGGTTLKVNGTTATLTIPFTGSGTADVHAIEFDPAHLDNLALEAEQSDLIAAGSVLEIITDGGPTAGDAIFTVVIRP